jgi:hypothetical protein
MATNTHASVYAYAELRGNQWVIPACPLCGSTHYHGAGRPGDDRTRFLGHRVAHCLVDRGNYTLSNDKALHGTEVPRP